MSRYKLIFENKDAKNYYNRIVVHSQETSLFYVKQGYQVYKVYENKEGHQEIELTITKEKYEGLQIREIIKKGVAVIKASERINTRDFTHIIEKLKEYGINFVDGQNMIIGSYLHEIGEN